MFYLSLIIHEITNPIPDNFHVTLSPYLSEEEGSPTFLNDGSKTLDESSIQSNASDTLEMRVMRRNATKHLRKDTYSICSTCNGSDGYCQIVSEDISCTNDDNVVNQSLDIGI